MLGAEWAARLEAIERTAAFELIDSYRCETLTDPETDAPVIRGLTRHCEFPELGQFVGLRSRQSRSVNAEVTLHTDQGVGVG